MIGPSECVKVVCKTSGMERSESGESEMSKKGRREQRRQKKKETRVVVERLELEGPGGESEKVVDLKVKVTGEVVEMEGSPAEVEKEMKEEKPEVEIADAEESEETDRMEAIKVRVAGKIKKLKGMVRELTGTSDEQRKDIRKKLRSVVSIVEEGVNCERDARLVEKEKTEAELTLSERRRSR